MSITLQKFVLNLKSLQKDFPVIVKKIIEEKSQEFIKANIDSWDKGKMPDGSEITNKFTGSTDYSLGWTVTRKEKGLPVGHYYLQFTGELSKSLFLEVKINTTKISVNLKPQSFVIDKAADLNKMFGDVIGIPIEYLTIFVTWFETELVKQLKLKLFAA